MTESGTSMRAYDQGAGKMLLESGICFESLQESRFDDPLGLSTGAADLFGASGGVMEAALRTVYEIITGRELPFSGLNANPVAGLEKIKKAAIRIEHPKPEWSFLDGVELRVAVTNGLAGAAELMEEVARGESPYHFIEVMGCPGGCITGGGQPRSTDPDVRRLRMEAIYREDEGKPIRKSHENPSLKSLYDLYLGAPGGHLSHTLLHKATLHASDTDERNQRPSGASHHDIYSKCKGPVLHGDLLPLKSSVDFLFRLSI